MQRVAVLTGHLNAAAANVSAAECGGYLENVLLPPPDAIFLTKKMYEEDKDPRKIDVGVGAYRTDDAKPYVLNVVRKAEAALLADKSINHEYLPIRGDQEFLKLAAGLLYGQGAAVITENRLALQQGLSGTGSLRIACDFFRKFLGNRTVYYSNPTWGNHLSIFFEAGLNMASYRYWDAKNRALDINGMLADIKAAPQGSIILLHTCAHNPTGVDPTREQWKQIAAVMKEKDHFPFFDSAYQGFATGDLDNDVWSLRYFVEQGFILACCQSFAKNLGLYGERTGTLSFVCKNAAQARAVEGQLEAIARPMYSNPPKHGALVAKTVMKNPELFAEWKEEMKMMSGRIFAMRKALHGHLVKLGTPGSWEHIVTQIGMFTFLGLTPQQCEILIKKYHIYLLKSSRISMAGLTTKNVEYMANAIHAVVTETKQ